MSSLYLVRRDRYFAFRGDRVIKQHSIALWEERGGCTVSLEALKQPTTIGHMRIENAWVLVMRGQEALNSKKSKQNKVTQLRKGKLYQL